MSSSGTASTLLLRLEGMNFGRFIADTDDLSTRRGAGLALLGVAEQGKALAEAALVAIGHASATVELLNQGASIALLKIDGVPETECARLQETLEARLRDQTIPPPIDAAEATDPLPAVKVGTFAVHALPVAAEGPSLALEMLVAKSRFHQMAASSIVPRPPKQIGLAHKVEAEEFICELDRISPADAKRVYKGSEHSVSPEAWQRRLHGFNRKHLFVQQRLKEGFSGTVPVLPMMANDLKAIADNGGPSDGKIALIYADGNSFNKFSRQWVHGGTPSAADVYRRLQDNDAFMRGRFAEFLARLVFGAMAKGDAGGMVRDADADEAAARSTMDPAFTNGFNPARTLKLEILRWGGDEICLAVPASCGLAVANLLFRVSRGIEAWNLGTSLPTLPQSGPWAFKNEGLGTDVSEPMHYKIGLVLCHDTAGISRIEKHGGSLAENIKKLRGTDTDGRLAYEVLESFDFIAPERDAHRRENSGILADAAKLLLPWRAMASLEAAVRTLAKTKFPRRRLMRIAQMSHHNSTKVDVLAEIGAAAAEGKDATDAVAALAKELRGAPAAPDDWLIAAWLHCEALKDYVPENPLFVFP